MWLGIYYYGNYGNFGNKEVLKVFCWLLLNKTFILKTQTEICKDEMKRYLGLLQKKSWAGVGDDEKDFLWQLL